MTDVQTGLDVENRGGCVWVFAASPQWDVQATTEWLPGPDYIVAADGGTSAVEQLGLVPDLVLGDLDSSNPALTERLRAAGVEIRRFDHNTKLETDTELATLAALEWRPERIYLLGVIGGRLDHSLANVLLLTHPQLAGEDVRLVDGRQEVYLAKSGMWNPIEGKNGDTVTLLPVGGDVRGVRSQGLRWPLAGDTLLVGHGRGVSNLVEGVGAQVWLDAGCLLVVALHD